KGEVGKVASLLIGIGQPGHVRLGAGLLILVLALVTSLTDARASVKLGLGHGAFASAVVLRWAALAIAARIHTVAVGLLTVLAILLPWLAMALRFHKLEESAPAPGRLLAAAAKLIARLWHSSRSDDRPSAIELIVLTLSVGVFAYMLWSGSSFRWSIFEERDFLEARQVLSAGTFPIYGPELLAGGHTVRGGLVPLLAPG